MTSAGPWIANLGMYDPLWLQSANDALWTAMRTRLAVHGYSGMSDALDRARPLAEIWHDPRLLVGQTCGYPLMTHLGEAVTLIGTPVYDLPGCDGTSHCSFVIVPEGARFKDLDDLRGCRLALNDDHSNTGMNLLRHAVAPLARDGRFFGAVVETGGHLHSMESVRRGETAVAAVDCVTFGLAARHRPDLTSGLRILARTASGPALPFVTHGGASAEEVDVLRQALNEAIAEAEQEPLIGDLALRRVEPAGRADYAVLLRYEAEGVAAGYPTLA
ncbi:MAG: phosphate/phosphonate transporter substrate-binding protein [Xanthobacteraceae bacterium]|jgi:ABC-type phosphate/phosphonate transport system substrate-binding protein|nr:phosphate/phosphonate transporter substrate-binding protein [Xanthobacteraceae bacterium]